jgi:anti-sigma B factor antagonist
MDLTSVADLEAHVDAALGAGETRVVIDLEHVRFLDSAVLHTLFRTVHRVRGSGGDVAIVCVNPTICRLLDVFGLASEVRVCPTVPLAAATLAA